MDHIAILRKAKISKDDNLLGDILTGAKDIESRWYINKVSPWDKIHVGDTIYFKESGKPVSARANALKVLQYTGLTPEVVSDIIKKYGSRIAPKTPLPEFEIWAQTQNKKRYCILVFLHEVQEIAPFEISKKGYGISSAWMCVGDINTVLVK